MPKTQEKPTTTEPAKTGSNWTGKGYGPKGSSDFPFFFLSDKGQSCRLRLFTEPYRYEDYIPSRSGDKEVKRVAWGALQRFESGEQKVVVFQSTPQVYDQVMALIENDAWGMPDGYDIQVTRTEDANAYYRVLPIEGTKSPMGATSRGLIDAAAIDVEAIVNASLKPRKTTGSAAAAVATSQAPAVFD